MNTSDVLISILAVGVLLAVLVTCFFYTQVMIDFNLRMIDKSWTPASYKEWYTRFLKKKWVYYNAKICGVIGMLFSALGLFFIVYGLFNKS